MREEGFWLSSIKSFTLEDFVAAASPDYFFVFFDDTGLAFFEPFHIEYNTTFLVYVAGEPVLAFLHDTGDSTS
jgi:hypothetical protein